MDKPGWENPVRMAECKLCGQTTWCQVYFGSNGNDVVAFMACSKCVAEKYGGNNDGRQGKAT